MSYSYILALSNEEKSDIANLQSQISTISGGQSNGDAVLSN